MPFRFRFKPLLRHRQFKLREAQSALAIAQSLEMDIEGAMDRLRRRIRIQGEQLEKEQESGIDAARYFLFKNFLHSLERELLLMQNELNKACNEVEFRKQAVVESNKSLKVLEDMESKEKEAYRVEQVRQERKVLDDVAIFKNYRDCGRAGGES
jgi:flagellar export protein FliJ